MSSGKGDTDDISDRDPAAPTETVIGSPAGPIAAGKILDERYQVCELLGRGGMGEVWRAFDLKLRVEVALKALREDLFRDEGRLEMLRSEVRAAREVVSPNVCRVFDLIEVSGSELVSMEYVDGGTLLEVLRERGPLELKEAQDIASQFLAGLEAIHKAGLVHRDVKPENIMITRTGRVVLMDFGIARRQAEGGGTVAGTPAYMAPEQAAGQTVDARADVYAAGVVLAEMVSPNGIDDLDSRRSLWEGVRSEPVRLPDTPWAQVLKKAVAKHPDQRHDAAHTLNRELEDVTLRVAGAEDLTPYPGLAAYAEQDAEFFFGREAEIERTWRKLEGTHLLGIVGPSGAGKTSFIEAGLVPNAPPGWTIVRCTPGNAATASLARLVARETAGDRDAVELLPRFGEPDVAVEVFKRWRRRSDRALLIVDRFEELFTLNSDAERSRFAELLGRLVVDADVRLLLSMRDDFLIQCRAHDPLVPLFGSLVPLLPPTGAALRRALVQPALKCGYRFEDDALADELLADVEDERGALPLLAFAVSRLWEKRDRANGILTRQAYHDVGGVGGALARHAEMTIDRVGADRIPIVRELFRNLITAEGTRVVRERDDLLSVFDRTQRQAANDVLRELVDARLLTTYEIQQEDQEPVRRVEIIHESLLANWPRLVRWQTQDADAAQLRDQVRQAARTWDEHDRSDDLLWAGTPYREFASWRERYPGGLSDVEAAFGAAMTAHAGRRRRRRRIVVTTVIVLLVVGLTVVGSFWRESVRVTRRAEAARLVTLGQMELLRAIEPDSTMAVAYALASLELADSEQARLLALEALWQRPPRREIPTLSSWGIDFSPDGRRLAVGVWGKRIGIWDSAGGEPTVLKTGDPIESWVTWVRFAVEPDVLFAATGQPGDGAQLWSLPERRLLRRFECDGRRTIGRLADDGRRLVTRTANPDGSRVTLREWPLPDGGPIELGELPLDGEPDIDPTATWMAYPDATELKLLALQDLDDPNAPVLAVHDHRIGRAVFDQTGKRVATLDDSGAIRLWSVSNPSKRPLGTLRGCPADSVSRGLGADAAFSADGSQLALVCDGVKLWNLGRPQEAAPLGLEFDGTQMGVSFDPLGRWLGVTAFSAMALWPLDDRYPSVMMGHSKNARTVVFAPDGRWLASSSWDGTVRLWPVSGTGGYSARVLFSGNGNNRQIDSLAVSTDGRHLVAGNRGGEIWIIPVDGDEPRLLGRINDYVLAIAVSPDGQTIATGSGWTNQAEQIIRLWDLDSGRQRTLDPGDAAAVEDLVFMEDGHLLSAGGNALRRWDLGDGSNDVLMEGDVRRIALCADQELVLVNLGEIWASGSVRALSLVDGEWLDLPAFGHVVRSIAVDRTGTVAITGGTDGIVRVGPAGGGDAHLLFAENQRDPWGVAVSPDGRWIAAGGDDGAVRVWPMPDISKPPLQTLPRDLLIAKLESLTNLRVVCDEESPIGWKLIHDPFPGWETVPTW